jgi:hypothetical protein
VPCTTTSLIVTTRRQPTIHFRWTSTTHPVYSTFAPLAHNHLPTYLSSVAAITYIFILFTFLFSDFIPSPLLPIDDPFFSNARSFGSYRFRTRMYFVSRAPATTRRNIKKRRSKKKHTWILRSRGNFFGFYFRYMRTAKQGQKRI